MPAEGAAMVLNQEVVFEQEIKKSRFIAYLSRVKSAEEAREYFSEIRKMYPDATHVCTAFRIGSQSGSSDDGEPAQTAGRPMLSVLASSEADEIAAAVVRYFGGTLLGKGGLVRAYSSSVAQAMKQAAEDGAFSETKTLQCFQLRYDYSLIGKVDHYLSSHHIEILNRDYAEKAITDIAALQDPSQDLQAVCAGSIEILPAGSIQAQTPLSAQEAAGRLQSS